MASSGLAEVVSLSAKAHELFMKGHYERGLVKCRSAVAAAKALGAEDCVIVAMLKTEVADILLAREYAREDSRFSQAVALEVLELLTASAAILRRRRDAGTLLEKKCRPDEEKWFMDYIAHGRPREEIAGLNTPMRLMVELVGYEAFIGVCDSCTTLLHAASASGAFEHGGEAECALLSFVCDIWDEAVALMVQPRKVKLGTYMEMNLIAAFPEMVEALALAPGYQVWLNRAFRAFARLRQSGVIETRGLQSDMAAQLRTRELERNAHADQALAAAAASGLLKSCAMVSCGAKEAHVSHFGKCGSCKTVAYCCRDHQLADWQTHKAACKAARKAAAAAKDAA